MKILLILFLVFNTTTFQKNYSKSEREKSIFCMRMIVSRDNETSLLCGRDEKGEDIILDIPDYVYRFPQGELFLIDVLKTGKWVIDPLHQPKGSEVLVIPPCRTSSLGYRIPPTQRPLCNPEG